MDGRKKEKEEAVNEQRQGERKEKGRKEKEKKGRNIAFALYFFFICLVTQPCPTLCDPMD